MSGRHRRSGPLVMNVRRVEGAAAKLQTPGIEGVGARDWPLPAPVKRSAIVAPLTLQPVTSRLARKRGR